MLYQLAPRLTPIALGEYAPDTLTAGMIGVEELEEYRARFGFAEGNVTDCLFDQDNYRNTIDVYEDYTFGIVTIVDANDVFQPSDKVAFFFKRNLFLAVSLRDEDGSTTAAFEQAVRRYRPESVTLEKVIYAMLEGTITRDAQALAKIEFEIGGMEEAVARGDAEHDFNLRIFERKKELLLLRNYYEQLIDIGEELEENENDIFEEDSLHYFALFTAKANRLSSNVQLLRDSLNQLREAHQAAMDYSLNKVMKLFSVITTICLPLTLIVGWYGMNFTHMPELNWKYGYPGVALVCVVIVAANLILFKRKKWF